MFPMEESDEVFDAVIRYGLYLVAIFQLVCITTVFLLTDQSNDSKVIINNAEIIYINSFLRNKDLIVSDVMSKFQ